jgi:hypothetical protein
VCLRCLLFVAHASIQRARVARFTLPHVTSFSSHKIWNNTKGGSWSIEEGAVKFSKYIGTTSISRNDDERAEVTWAHLVIKRFLNGGMANKYKVAKRKVVVLDRVCVLFFKPYSCFDLGFVNLRMKLGEVRESFLKCDGSSCNKFGCQKN